PPAVSHTMLSPPHERRDRYAKGERTEPQRSDSTMPRYAQGYFRNNLTGAPILESSARMGVFDAANPDRIAVHECKLAGAPWFYNHIRDFKSPDAIMDMPAHTPAPPSRMALPGFIPWASPHASLSACMAGTRTATTASP